MSQVTLWPQDPILRLSNRQLKGRLKQLGWRQAGRLSRKKLVLRLWLAEECVAAGLPVSHAREWPGDPLEALAVAGRYPPVVAAEIGH